MLIDHLLNVVKPISRKFELFLEDLKEAKVIKAQNVADYIYETWDQKEWTLSRDFPNVAPPFEVVWLEWTYPLVMQDSTEISGGRCPLGVLLKSLDLKNIDPEDRPLIENQFRPEIVQKSRWITLAVFLWQWDRKSFHCPPTIAWGVSEEGVPIFHGDKFLCNQHPFVTREELTPRDMENAGRMFWHLTVPFMCFSFMHCKNVQLVKGPPHPIKLQQSRQKKGKLPLVRWNTLSVEPIKHVIASANGGNSALTPKSLHICRGHFKDYNDKGLFGRIKGRFWWSDQARGSASVGEIHKDYAVRPALQTEPVLEGATHGQ